MKINTIIRLLRLDKPTGALLLFLPCSFAVAIFSTNYQELWYYLFFFFVGSIIMRSAGCIINDMLDKDYDAQVERTKSRPIASGEITIPTALKILLVLLILGLLILIQLPAIAIKIGFIAGAMIFIYPLIKRFSNLPQLFLGLAFNIGSLIAASTITKTIPITSIIVYVGCIFWTIGYDTVYGFMDIKDDKRIGIKSTSRLLENYNFRALLAGFYTIFILCLFSACWIETHSQISYLLLVIWLGLIYTSQKLDTSSIKSCLHHFNLSTFWGIQSLLILISANYL